MTMNLKTVMAARTSISRRLAVAIPVVALAVLASTATLAHAAAQDPVEQSRVPGAGREVPAGRGIVEGRVIDALSGRPLQGARVQVMGGPDFGSLTTDSDGRYELDLRPGRYRVTVNAEGYTTGFYGPQNGRGQATVDVQPGRIATGIDVRMRTAGRLSGQILDDRGQPLAGVEIELTPASFSAMALGGPRAEFARTGADGSYRIEVTPGEYVVRAYVDGATRPARNAALTYLSTYYPGVRSREEAQSFRIESGAEQYDVSFALAVGRPVRIAGVVTDPSGGDLGDVRVSLRSVGPDGSNREIAVPVNRDGAFDARDLAPGAYMVTVVDPQNPGRWAGVAQPIVTDGDALDLDLRAVPTSSVFGRVVPGARSGAQPDLTQTRVAFVMPSPDARTSAGALEIADDGTFTGTMPGGRLLLNVSALPPGWAVRSMRLDDVDVFGKPVDIAPGRHELEIVIAEATTSVHGVVVDQRGTPLAGYTVILFPGDETQWHAGSPFIQQTGSLQDGRFEVRSLPAGDYLAVAIEQAGVFVQLDPQPLAYLEPIATRLTVLEGEQTTISIRASPTPAALAR
jgi:protocatechuate 3,4-dioxygenase beta subunit